MEAKQKISLLKSTLWLLGAGILVTASYWSIRLAVADMFYRRNTITSLTSAVALASGDAEYHALLAEHLEGVGTDPDPQFLKAAELSPRDSRYWIRLGFSAESKGNYKRAEDYLLKAAAVNRKFDPAWALMNFYFRRGQADRFWLWADRAMAMSYGDMSAIYRLFWNVSGDALVIRSHIPPKRAQLAAYLDFVERNQHAEAAAGAARDLARIATADEAAELEHYCAAAAVSNLGAALEVWNTLCARRLLPLAPLDPLRGDVIADPTFRIWPPKEGFGWQTSPQDEIFAAPPDDAQGLHLRLSGNQPDGIFLLEALAPVTPGEEFRIRYRMKRDRGAVLDGVAWQVWDFAVPPHLLAQADFEKVDGTGFLRFEASKSPVRLRLMYKRPLGSITARGGFTLLSVGSEIER